MSQKFLLSGWLWSWIVLHLNECCLVMCINNVESRVTIFPVIIGDIDMQVVFASPVV